MGQKIASLEIDLMMATGQFVEGVGIVDRGTADMIRNVQKVDAAVREVGGLDPLAASAVQADEQLRKAAASVRELNRAKKEYDQAEAGGERVVAQLDRQIAAYGKTTAELRQMKAETAALRAEQAGQTELAGRVRAKEAELWSMEYEAARKASEAQRALAEDRDAATAKAVAAAERDATATREAAQAHQMFEAAVRRGAAALREAEDVEKATTAASLAVGIRDAGIAYQQFEARVRAGAQAMREAEAAAERDAVAVARLREMIDPAVTSQARLTAQIDEARRVMTAAGFSAEEMAKAEQLLTARGGELAQSHGRMGIAGMEGMHIMRAFSDSIAAGQSPVRALTMEMGRITEAMSFWAMQTGQTEGAVGKLAGFMGGPWGMALTLAMAALAPLVMKLFEGDDAARAAAEGMKKFQDRQSDIGNFIDATTGALTEQNRALVLNAMLTRQAQIAANEKAISESRDKAFNRARDAALHATSAVPGTTTSGVGFTDDQQVQAVIRNAGTDVDKLSFGLAALAKSRPDLAKIALDVSGIGGQAITAQRENEKLGKELRALGGDTTALGGQTAEAIKKQVALATATTPLAHARAQLAIVEEQGTAATKAGGAALERWRTNLTQATNAVNSAEAAQQAHRHQITETNKATREAEAATKKQAAAEKALEELRASLGGHSSPAAKANEEYLAQLVRIGIVEKANLIDHQEAMLLQFQAGEKLRTQLAAINDDTVNWGHSLTHLPELNIKLLTPWQDEQDELAAQIDQTATMFSILDHNAQDAASGIREAFGSIGGAVGDALTAVTGYYAEQARLQARHADVLTKSAGDQRAIDRENRLYAAETSGKQIGLYGDMAAAAEGFFKKGSTGYKALHAAEMVFRVAQLANSIQAMIQNTAETISSVANSGAKAAASGAAGVAEQSKLPFPANIAAMAATAAALVAVGVSIAGIGGGGHNTLPAANTGTGTVLGDPAAKSASIKNAIDTLKSVDDATLTVSRDMLTSLRAIENNIGGLASLLVRTGNIDASAGVDVGVHSTMISGIVKSTIPIVGGLLGGLIDKLFGSKTTVVGSGLYGGDQSVGDILSGGYDLQTYSDIEKKKKFLGVTTSTKYSTVYGQADSSIDDQFTLVLRSFYEAISKAAPELGQATSDVEQRLNSFVFSIVKIDLAGKTGTEIQEQLENILGAAADNMAQAAVPGLDKFQKVGEGYFETLVRVATTVEQVDAVFQRLGRTSTSMGIDVDMAIAGLFDSVSDFTSAADAYFQSYYSEAEQAAAKTTQMGKAFAGLGLAMPSSLAGFRGLVEAQDLTTAAGQQTYATLLQLAPAFADLNKAMDGAKSAADIASERADLQRQLLQVQGDTSALRALDLAQLDESNRALQQRIWSLQDEQEATTAAAQAATAAAQAQEQAASAATAAAQAIASQRSGLMQQLWQLQGDTASIRTAQLAGLDESNRALQQQIYAITDAQEAAKAADTLREAWTAVGDSIMDEVKRISGLADSPTGGGFVQLMSQFNAATAAARVGDQDAAKALPDLSKSLLDAAALAATSRQELARVQAQTASSLEETYALMGGTKTSDDSMWSAAIAAASGASNGADDNGVLIARIEELTAEVKQLREENNAGNATVAGNTGRIDRKLDAVTSQSGGDAIAIVATAA